jgi:hypothetical protein
VTLDGLSRFSPSELGRLLVAPYAVEELSPLSGPGFVVLDLSKTSESEASLWQAALLDRLKILPCITIAIEADRPSREPESGAARRELALACDVALTEADDLDAFLAGFEETPIAALSFVQLLRSAPGTSIHAGLLAESFVYSTLQAGTEFEKWLSARAGASKAGVSQWFQRREKPPIAESATCPDPACRFERDQGRLTITLNRPEKHNAFSRAMRDSLVEGLQLAISDASIEEVWLRGEGPSFCSGGDLDEFGTADNPARAHVVRTTRSPAHYIAQLAGRIRAEVHGACLGAGVELPAFVDHVVANEDVYFQLPEVAMGLIPGAGGTVSLPRRIGRQRTAWLGLSGQRIDAEKALAWGLVDEVRLG